MGSLSLLELELTSLYQKFRCLVQLFGSSTITKWTLLRNVLQEHSVKSEILLLIPIMIRVPKAGR